MKIAICATGETLDSKISFVFGRCPYFILIDSKDKKNNFEIMANPAVQLDGEQESLLPKL